MKRHTSVVLIAFVVAGALALWADNKITKKMEMGPMTITETVYIKGARQRTESQNPMGGTTTTIEQCDKKQIIHINDSCKTYFIEPMDQDVKLPPPPKNTSSTPTTSEPTRKGGVVTITTTMKDLGETKQMFGYTARHIHTTMKMESSPDACNPSNMTMETDGWYAKVGGEAFTCPVRPHIPPSPRAASGGCRDTMRFHSSGGMNPGQPLSLTTTVQGHSFTQETTDLSKATLDASLFEPPAGYTQVDDYAGLQCNAGRPKYVIPNVTRNIPTNNDTGGDVADTESTRTKRRGHVRVGVVMPESHVNKEYDGQMWRDKLVDDLMQSHIEAVAIDATDRKGIQSEAADKKCDYILYTDVNEVSAPSTGKKLFGHITGSGGGGSYSAKTHLTLMPLNQTDPRLEADAEGKNSGDLNDAGLDAMQSQSDQVVEEFQKPWPRPKD